MFGQQDQPGANPTGGFNFGSTASGSSTGGFNFGSAAPTSAPAASGSQLPQAPASGGFSFGIPQVQAPAASTASPFKFGGLGTSTAAPSTTSLGFGAPAKPTGGLSLGSMAPSTAPGSTSGFGFSGTTAAPSTSATTGGFGFHGTAPTTAGTTTSGFSFGGGIKPSTSSATSTGGLPFGAAPAGTTTAFSLGGAKPATTTGTTQGGFTLGGIASSTPFLSNLVAAPPSNAASTLPTLGVAPQPSGGLQLGSAAASTTAGQTGLGLRIGGTTTPATGIGGGGLLLGQPAASTGTVGGLGLGLVKTMANTSTTASLGTTASSGFGLTGGLAAPTSGGLPFGAAPAGTTTGTAGTFGARAATTISATTTSVVTTPSAGQLATSSSTPQMTYKQLEEQINKWASELEDYERTFLDQAGQVNAWDRLLMENGEKITELNTNVESVKAEQKRLDEELDFILAQQQELEVLLKPLEEELKKRNTGHGQLQHADREREFTYGLSKDIDGQLKQMVGDLKAIIDHLNTAGSTQQGNNDPIVQVAKILNAHMNSLQWIDQNAALLQRKVDEVSSLSEIRRKEQERNFRLAFD